jgi:hypothetical protein
MSDIKTVETTLNDNQVAAYLRDNPQFFINHGGLLADLSLPHESGDAISLIERQVSVLRERNMDMRHRLSSLLDNARDNDKLFEHTKRLVLTLLEARDLGDGVDALRFSFDNEFNIEYTSLIFLGDASRIPGSEARVVSPTEARRHIDSLMKNNRAFCGKMSEDELTFLFGDKAASEIGSVACVPLVHGTTFGLLAIANKDTNYYRSSMGTLFLSYIAEVLNRTLPPHMKF